MTAFGPPTPSTLARFHGKPCPYCGKPMRYNPLTNGTSNAASPTRDHVVPRSQGGRRTIVCCSRCNFAKADRTPHEWLVHLEAVADRRAPHVRQWCATHNLGPYRRRLVPF